MRSLPNPRVDPVLLVTAGLVAGGLLLVAPLEAVLVATFILTVSVIAQRTTLRVAMVTAIAIGTGAIRARSAVARHEADRQRADAALPSPMRCSARAHVDSSPVSVRGAMKWEAQIDHVVCEGAPLSWTGRATLYGGPDDIAQGDVTDVVAMLAAPQRLWNQSSGDPRPGEARRGVIRSGGALDVRITRRGVGVLAWIDRQRARVRRRIEASFRPDIAPMVRALVLGESDLAPDDDQAFRASGLSHLLAVSGMHLVLVLAVAVRSLAGIFSRVEHIATRIDVGRLAATVGLPVTWLYAAFAGGGGSTVRAAWMMTAALCARAIGRQSNAVRAFALSLGVMATVDPLIAFDLSFALSAGATAGLLAFAEPLAQTFASHVPRLLSPVTGAAATTVAASIPCMPILARFAPTVPLGGVIANLIAVPLGECAALPLCLVHALLSRWPTAERGTAIVASGALRVVRAIARGFASHALAAEVPQPTALQMAVLAAMLGWILLHFARRFTFVASSMAALAALEILAHRSGAPRGVLRATFFDVGQGDSALVDLPDGQAILIDGGGLVGSPIDVGTRVVGPELRSRRRPAIAAVVLTHPHPDHFGGLATGLDGIRIGALWDTGQGERERVGGAYATLLGHARSLGVPVMHPDRLCGPHMLGGARIEVLAPCPDACSDFGPNDNSFVLRISYGARAILFVGDAEREEEASLLAAARDRLRADVLKVGHHGSRTSSNPAFLAAVAPSEAVISVGSRNRFGHPAPATLAALASGGARVWRTDRDGSVVVETDGKSIRIQGIAGGR